MSGPTSSQGGPHPVTGAGVETWSSQPIQTAPEGNQSPRASCGVDKGHCTFLPQVLVPRALAQKGTIHNPVEPNLGPSLSML